MKKYTDKNRKEVVEYKVENRVLLSTKDLTWQIRNKETKKLIKKFVRPYKIRKIISENVVELELPVLMKIHLVVNVSRIALYQEQIKRQKKISSLPVEIDREKKYEVEKNKELKLEIIWLHHNVPIAEHGERQKITELVTRNYQ